MIIDEEQIIQSILLNNKKFFVKMANFIPINYRIKSENNDTLLMYSLSFSDIHIYKFFLEKGADIGLTNNLGENIFHSIIYSNDVNRMNYILEDQSNKDLKNMLLNSQDYDGDTPLNLALFLKKLKVAHKLINYGVDVNIPNREGVTPLHIACINGYKHIVDNLLKKQANPLKKTLNGYYPLALAVNNNNIKIFQMLYNYIKENRKTKQ